MQTLEFFLTAVFEAMPGKNILLYPNPPFFTVASVSKTYGKKIAAKNFTGSPLSQLLRADNRIDDAGRKHIIQSVELAYETHEPQQMMLDYVDGQQYKVEHTPVISEEGDVMYIIQTRKLIRGKSFVSPESSMSTWEVLMQAPVGIALVEGKDFTLASANFHMLDLWGKTTEIIGKPLMVGIPEINDQPFPQLLRNVFTTGVEYHGYETKAILKRGDQLIESYFNFLYSPVKNEEGIVDGILMIATDVTGLVKAKRELEESEKRYRDLIQNATVATAVYTGDNMRILLANEAMIKLWGKDTSVIGKPLMEALPELEGQPFINLLEMVYRTGVTYRSTEDKAELVVDGVKQSFFFNFTYKALRNSSGQIYGVLNMAVDVTETVSSKNNLSEAEERWRVALDSAELGTWDYYPETGEIVCSQRTKELFGLAVDSPDPTPQQLITCVVEQDRERIRDELRKALENRARENFRIEYEIVGINDEKARWHRVTGHVFFDRHSRPYRVTGTLLDISEAKRLEEALEDRVLLRTVELLEANEKLERSNRELEQYAYVASHDLQEPLRKILVYAGMLKTSAAASDPSDAVRIEKISAAAQRMSHLIQDLLNFSRLIKAENVFAPVNLMQIVKDVVDDLELKIAETKARIDIGELPEIEASSQQMVQLFQNLLSNALKFRRDNATPVVRISARKMSAKEVGDVKSLNPDLEYHCITVTDNGIGFNEKYLEQIFEIFKRLHNKNAYEGTGIGLALCRKIARNHGGDIFAVSREGEGSQFRVVLPDKQAHPKSKEGLANF